LELVARNRQIISHRNYNPRLIRYITDSDRITNCTAQQYWPHAKELLDNPAKVWENPFEAQHDDFGRALILLVTLNARPIAQGELAESYARYIAHPDAKAMQGRRDYLQSVRHLAGSMLTRVVAGGKEPVLNLFNPSIGDFVLHRYASDLPSLRAGFSSLRSTASLRTLADLERNQLISTQAKAAVLDAILDGANASGYIGYASEYIALALVNYTQKVEALSPTDKRIVSASDFVANSQCPANFADVAEVLQWRFSHALSTEQDIAEFVANACDVGANSTELSRLSSLMHKLSEDRVAEFWPSVEELAVSYFSDAVHDEFSDEDVFHAVDPESTHDAKRNLARLIEEKFDNLGIPVSDSSVETIAEAFNVPERSQEYFRPEPDYDCREGRKYSAPQLDAVDDLFDRSR
jgi:hypothetical protein